MEDATRGARDALLAHVRLLGFQRDGAGGKQPCEATWAKFLNGRVGGQIAALRKLAVHAESLRAKFFSARASCPKCDVCVFCGDAIPRNVGVDHPLLGARVHERCCVTRKTHGADSENSSSLAVVKHGLHEFLMLSVRRSMVLDVGLSLDNLTDSNLHQLRMVARGFIGAHRTALGLPMLRDLSYALVRTRRPSQKNGRLPPSSLSAATAVLREIKARALRLTCNGNWRINYFLTAPDAVLVSEMIAAAGACSDPDMRVSRPLRDTTLKAHARAKRKAEAEYEKREGVLKRLRSLPGASE